MFEKDRYSILLFSFFIALLFHFKFSLIGNERGLLYLLVPFGTFFLLTLLLVWNKKISKPEYLPFLLKALKIVGIGTLLFLPIVIILKFNYNELFSGSSSFRNEYNEILAFLPKIVGAMIMKIVSYLPTVPIAAVIAYLIRRDRLKKNEEALF